MGVEDIIKVETWVLDSVALGNEAVEMELCQGNRPITVRVYVDKRNKFDIIAKARELKGARIKFEETIGYGQPRDSRGRGPCISKRTYTEMEVLDKTHAGQKYVSDTTKYFT